MAEPRKLGLNGSYDFSESNYFDEHLPANAWGTNYKRLQAAKAKYDPDGLFSVHHGRSGEEWKADGFTRIAPHVEPAIGAAIPTNGLIVTKLPENCHNC